MRASRSSFVVSIALLVAALLGPPERTAAAPTQPTPLAVIVGASSRVQELSHALVRRIFLGEQAAADGVTFVPFNYAPSDPLRIAFDLAALGFSPDAAGRYWVDRRIRGQGLPPRTVPSATLLRAVIARLPGAIGYLPPSMLTPEVRAVRIDGLPHDDPDYPLAD